MKTYAIVPGERGYWIVETSGKGPPSPIERFDSEDAAVQRLRVLEQNARILAQQNLAPPKKAP
jgi:hypothetical protein